MAGTPSLQFAARHMHIFDSVREDHETNLHTFGRKVWRISNNNHIKRETSQCFWLSRDSYERLLRRLVLKSSNRVRWITGTVTGFDANPKDLSILSSVTLRLPDGTEQKVPSTLVIGACYLDSELSRMN